MKSLFRPFPVPLTPRQIFYLGVLQGVGAGFIDGGANFAVAYAMYHGQTDVRMWVFSKNTIAGDLGVTPIIQCLASMLITSTLVHTDLHHHAIAPLPFVYPHVEHLPDPRTLFKRTPGTASSDPEKAEADDEAPRRGRLGHYFWMLVRFIFEGTEKNMMAARIPVSHWLGRLVWTAAQGAAIGIVFGLPLWCLAVVILGPIYGNGNMGNKWAPQVIKCVYGAILGWITNPVIATLALGSQAECHLVVVEHDEDGAGEAAAEGVPTIPEDEEFIASPSMGRRSTLAASPALSPSRPMSGLPVPGTPSLSARARAGSTASRTSKPPLTTNVSLLSPLPPPPDDAAPLPASPTPDRSGRPRGNSYTISQRPRGATVSSYSSNRSYSYALGGTGGRAQRPRAASRASATASGVGTGIPSLVLPTSGLGQRPDGPGGGNNVTLPGRSTREAPTAAWDVFGRNDTPQGLAISSQPAARQRAQSAVERAKPTGPTV